MTAMRTEEAAYGEGDLLRLKVFMAPTTHALARLLVLVRGRGAKVLDLRWRATPGAAEGTVTLLIGLDSARHPHLLAAIERSVDVTHTAVL